MSEKDSTEGGSDSCRRKRLAKNTSARSNFSGQSSHSLSDGSPLNSPMPCNSTVDTISVLSSPLSVFQVLSSFEPRKKDILQSIGFAGIVQLPCITYENKEFTIWLLKRLKWPEGCLILGDNFSITLKAEHIGKISGLSYTGIDISSNSLKTESEKMFFIKSKLGFLDSGVGILQAAENYVMQEFPSTLTKEHIDHFKIAFVIFVVGRFLAPSTEHPDGNHNFWGALQNPDQIGSFNWSSYVLSVIKDAARLANWERSYKKTFRHVPGCPLMLQIFYLDNLDFGELNLSHDSLPRWQNFSNDSFSAMIEADKRVRSFGSSRSVYGRTKVLREGSSCYTIGNYATSFNPPIGFTTSHLRRGNQESSTPEHSSSEKSLPLIAGFPLQNIINRTPDIANHVLDFSDVLRQNYQGEVDPNFLEDLKAHNAKCLNHITDSYHSLAAAIVNENVNIAMKFIEQHNSYKTSTTATEINANCAPRRRRYNDFISGTDSSTEGEETLNHCKIPRTMIPSGTTAVPSTSITTEAVIVSSECPPRTKRYVGKEIIETNKEQNELSLHPGHNRTSGSQFGSSTNELFRCFAPSHSCPTKSSSVKSILEISTTASPVQLPIHIKDNLYGSSAPDHSIPLDRTIKYSHCLSQPVVGCSIPIYGKNILPSSSTHNEVATSAIFNASATETPEATLKMGFFSPDVSPTTEHQVFSGACLSVRMLDSLHGIDLNASTFEVEYNSTYQSKKIVCPGSFSLSHWEMHSKLDDIEPNVCNGFLKWLSTSANELDRDWIVHSSPRFIKLSGIELKDQFAFNKPMTFDLFDVAIRRIKQLDKVLYPTDIPLRWRHILESDYALHALGYENPVENKSVREQFVGPECNYELCRCCMFFVPVFVQGKWWAYAWNLKTHIVYILDPSVGNESDAKAINKHSGTINQLSKSLSSTTDALFLGWSPKFSACEPSVVRFIGMPYRSQETGIMTLFCLMNFDGNKLVVHPTEIEVQKFRAYFLYQLMSINKNIGRKPSAYVQIVD